MRPQPGLTLTREDASEIARREILTISRPSGTTITHTARTSTYTRLKRTPVPLLQRRIQLGAAEGPVPRAGPDLRSTWWRGPDLRGSYQIVRGTSRGPLPAALGETGTGGGDAGRRIHLVRANRGSGIGVWCDHLDAAAVRSRFDLCGDDHREVERQGGERMAVRAWAPASAPSARRPWNSDKTCPWVLDE